MLGYKCENITGWGKNGLSCKMLTCTRVTSHYTFALLTGNNSKTNPDGRQYHKKKYAQEVFACLGPQYSSKQEEG